MRSNSLEIDALNSVESISFNVRFRNLWRYRLGLFFIRLACLSLRCGLEVSVNGVPLGHGED